MSTMSDIVWRAIHHSSAGGMISPPMLCLQMHRRALRYKLSRRCLAWALIKLRLYLAWLVVFALCVIRFYFCIYCCITIKECVCVGVCVCVRMCVCVCTTCVRYHCILMGRSEKNCLRFSFWLTLNLFALISPAGCLLSICEELVSFP